MRIYFLIASAVLIAAGAFLLKIPTASASDVTLYKTPGCMCCEGYADYLKANGFAVTVKPTHELSKMSSDAGIPEDFQGCHLAFIEGYAVSGHVPRDTVKRLLSERPDIKGITLPGMPNGSPGMGGSKAEPFTIYEIGGTEPKVYAVE